MYCRSPSTGLRSATPSRPAQVRGQGGCPAAAPLTIRDCCGARLLLLVACLHPHANDPVLALNVPWTRCSHGDVVVLCGCARGPSGRGDHPHRGGPARLLQVCAAARIALRLERRTMPLLALHARRCGNDSWHGQGIVTGTAQAPPMQRRRPERAGCRRLCGCGWHSPPQRAGPADAGKEGRGRRVQLWVWLCWQAGAAGVLPARLCARAAAPRLQQRSLWPCSHGSCSACLHAKCCVPLRMRWSDSVALLPLPAPQIRRLPKPVIAMVAG